MMPASPWEMVEWVRACLDGHVMPDTIPVWMDGTQATDAEREEMLPILIHEALIRRDARRKAESHGPRRKAYRLLRKFLTPAQRAQMDRSRCFDVTAASGRTYRFWPGSGVVDEVERHGRNWYAIRSFCIHPDPEHALPGADVALSQALLLSVDEEEFLRIANARNRRSDQLWNGDWLRRVRQGRLERQQAAA